MRGKRTVVVLAVTAGVVSLVAKSQQGERIHGMHGTLLYRGSMASDASFRMTGALSVGHMRYLSWDLPRPTTTLVNGYSEDVAAPKYAFNVKPDSYKDMTSHGHAVREFNWTSPPSNTVLRVVMTMHMNVHSTLAPLSSTATYPVSSIPVDVKPYLRSTHMVWLPGSYNSAIKQLKGGNVKEADVVNAVANWVATHTHYSRARMNGPFEASWVILHHQANCKGYDNLMVAILRKLHIPAQVVYGWVTSSRLTLPSPYGKSYLQWSTPGSAGELHTWLNVYFPDKGWVPFDPQREKFFIDSHHYAFLTNIDAGDPNQGEWSAYNTGSNPLGKPLSNGSTEVVPGDGYSSKVAVNTHDAVNVAYKGMQADVGHVLLFAR
jgi:hypothetical protein